MGHRANYALQQDGRVTFGRDRWGALGIPDCLFGGFEQAAAQIRLSQVEGPERFYDNTDCEGCLLVDADNKTIMFDGISELMWESDLRQISIRALLHDWPGWEFLYAQRGILDVGEYLSLSSEIMRRLGSDGPLYHLVSEEQILRPEYPQERDPARTEIILLGLEQNDSFLSDYSATALLEHGSQLVELLRQAPPVDLGLKDKLHAVVQVDPRLQLVSVWQDIPDYRVLDRIRPNWPEWEVSKLSAQDAEASSSHPSATWLSDSDAAAAVTRFSKRWGQARAEEMEKRALNALADLRLARAG